MKVLLADALPDAAVERLEAAGDEVTRMPDLDADTLPEHIAGFEVLIKGERGRRSTSYQVWSTDANGVLTNKTGWMDNSDLAQAGYETTFNTDFNGDDLIGAPSGLDLQDADANGLVDGLTHYALLQGSGEYAQMLDLTDSRGRTLSAAKALVRRAARQEQHPLMAHPQVPAATP